MVVLINGASHTGKTALSQKILEEYKFPYLSLDLLKMGLIRSGNTKLNALSNKKDLTDYLWPIVVEMIKTAIENKQNLVVEGSYIPFTYKDSFEEEYLKEIKYYCLIMSEKYIKNHYSVIIKYANIVENRVDESEYTMEYLIKENEEFLRESKQQKQEYILIDDDYEIHLNL